MNRVFENGVLILTRDDGHYLKMAVHPETRLPWESEAQAFAYEISDKFGFIDPSAVVETTALITQLQFMERFTESELVAIYTAAKQNIQIEVWLDKVKLAQEIDLTNQSLINGLHALEASGVIAQGRADEILSIS